MSLDAVPLLIGYETLFHVYLHAVYGQDKGPPRPVIG